MSSVDPGMDETVELLVDRVTETHLKLISADEARALMVLLGLLGVAEQPQDIRRSAVEMRFRLGSRLA
ncbi:hypothetical protein [Streptomyces sp. NPDC054883]